MSEPEYIQLEDLFDVLDELEPVKAEWYGLGLGLKLRKSDLEAIKKDHQESLDCLREALHLWLDRINPPPTWQKVIEILRRPAAVRNGNTLADKLARKHCPELVLAQERGAATAVVCQAQDDSTSSLMLDDNHPTAVATQPQDQSGNAAFLYPSPQSTAVAEDDQEDPSPTRSITASTGSMVTGRQPSVQLSPPFVGQPPIPDGSESEAQAESPDTQPPSSGSGVHSSMESSSASAQRSRTGGAQGGSPCGEGPHSSQRVTTDGDEIAEHLESGDQAESPDAQPPAGGSGFDSSVEGSVVSEQRSKTGSAEDDSVSAEGSSQLESVMTGEPQGGAVTGSPVRASPEPNSDNNPPAQPMSDQPGPTRRKQHPNRQPPSQPEPSTETLSARDLLTRSLSQLTDLGYEWIHPRPLTLLAAPAVILLVLALAAMYWTEREPNECNCMLVHKANDVINAVHEDISDWYSFGDDLGLSSTTLDRIKADERKELQRLKKTVRVWYDHQPHGACWEEVVNAINKMGNPRLAKKIADEHGVSWKAVSPDSEVLQCIQKHTAHS